MYLTTFQPTFLKTKFKKFKDSKEFVQNVGRYSKFKATCKIDLKFINNKCLCTIVKDLFLPQHTNRDNVQGNKCLRALLAEMFTQFCENWPLQFRKSLNFFCRKLQEVNKKHRYLKVPQETNFKENRTVSSLYN